MIKDTQIWLEKNVYNPLQEKEIPIVADEYPDPEQGTGAVKNDSAHDFNDFEVGKRRNLEIINIMTKDGKMNKLSKNIKVWIDLIVAKKS